MVPPSSRIKLIVLPEMDVKDIRIRYHEVPGDIKDTTSQTDSVTNGNSDVSVMKEVDNTHQLEYSVVIDGASGMSIDREINKRRRANRL
jgi:hypothetical protein